MAVLVGFLGLDSVLIGSLALMPSLMAGLPRLNPTGRYSPTYKKGEVRPPSRPNLQYDRKISCEGSLRWLRAASFGPRPSLDYKGPLSGSFQPAL
jgi:hypothetical protein